MRINFIDQSFIGLTATAVLKQFTLLQFERYKRYIKVNQIDFVKQLNSTVQLKRLAFYVLSKHVKGTRLVLGLPLRGQRTRTNRKTARKLNRALAAQLSAWQR